MKEEKNKKNWQDEKFGEFVPSEFEWIDPEKQKKIANKLANITKPNKEK